MIYMGNNSGDKKLAKHISSPIGYQREKKTKKKSIMHKVNAKKRPNSGFSSFVDNKPLTPSRVKRTGTAIP